MNRSYWDNNISKFDIVILFVFKICAWQLRCTYCRHAHQQHKWAEIRSKIGHYVYRSAEDEPRMQVSTPSKIFEWFSDGWAAAISIYVLQTSDIWFVLFWLCRSCSLLRIRSWQWRSIVRLNVEDARWFHGFMVSPDLKLQTHLAEADLWCPCFRDSISFAGARSNQLVVDKGCELRVYSGHHCFEASSFGTEFV